MEIQRKTERKVPDSGKVKTRGIGEQAGMEGESEPGGPQGLDQNSYSVLLKEHPFPDHLLCAEQGLGMGRRC